MNSDPVDIIYDFYPRGIEFYDPRYENSEETKKLKRLLSTPPNWKEARKFSEWLRVEYGESQIEDMTLFSWGNPCYHFRLYAKYTNKQWFKYIILISIIDDVYFIYKDGNLARKKSENTEPEYAKIKKGIEKHFVGFREIESDLLHTKVSDIALPDKDLGEDVTLLDCIFTTHIY